MYRFNKKVTLPNCNNLVVLAIFANFDNDSYSIQVPKTVQKEGIAHKFDSKRYFSYKFSLP